MSDTKAKGQEDCKTKNETNEMLLAIKPRLCYPYAAMRTKRTKTTLELIMNLPENPTFEEVEAFFAQDRFAVQMAGCRIVEGRPGYAICKMPLEDTHRNAMGAVMGGAIFTLADFTFAVASNIGGTPTVSVDSTINHLAAPKGNELVATAQEIRQGSHLGFYRIDICDDMGRMVAQVHITGYR